MATVQFALPYRPAWDSNGKVISGAQLYFTLTGTNTPITVYGDELLTEPLLNPVVANAAGRFPTVHYDDAVSIRARLYDADDEAGVDTPLEDYNPYLGFASTTTVDAVARTDAATANAALAGKADKTGVVKTPLDYGCVGDGTTDDAANFLTALQSGFVIDGLGKTYALNSQLQPTSFVGLRNATFKWVSTAAMSVQNRALLHIYNLDNWFVDNLKFDMGTVENIGATGAPDNIRAGFRTTNAAYSDNCRITNLEAYGSGAGTGIELRNLKDSYVSGNYVHDRIVSDVGITNDCQNGIHFHDIINSTMEGNRVARLYLRVGAALNKKWSRGILTSSCIDCIYDNQVSFVDQGHDFSGSSPGNKGLKVSGQASDVFTYGFKFANVARDFTIDGAIVRRFGYGAFVWSGNAGEGANQTQNHLVAGCYAFEFTGEFNGTGHAFWIQSGTGYPRGIRLESCGVSTASGGGLINGFSNSASLGSVSYPNTVKNCHSVGQSGTIDSGFHENRAKVAYTASAPTGAATIATLPTPDAADNTMGHWVSGQPTRFTMVVPGVYRIIARASFAANATGNRSIGVVTAGGSIGGDAKTAISGTATPLEVVIEHKFALNEYVTLALEQNSGVALSTEMFFQAEYLRPA